MLVPFGPKIRLTARTAATRNELCASEPLTARWEAPWLAGSAKGGCKDRSWPTRKISKRGSPMSKRFPTHGLLVGAAPVTGIGIGNARAAQPRMEAAIEYLQSARGELQAAAAGY